MDRVCLKSKTKSLKEVLEILDLPFSEYLLRKGIAIKVFKKAINSYTPSDWKRYSNVFKYLGEEKTLIKEFFPNSGSLVRSRTQTFLTEVGRASLRYLREKGR